MPRQNPVRREYIASNGQIYRGKSIKGAKKLDRRVKDYEEFVTHSANGGKGFNKPGSIKK